jgi:nucleotide-binding universal stress UspA family protein
MTLDTGTFTAEEVGMYKKILVPLDGSKRAEAIMSHVVDLASCYCAAVILLQIVEPIIAYTSPYDAYPELNMDQSERRTEEANSYLAGWANKLAEKEIETICLNEHGPVVMTILDVAENEDADLIAMASHGRTGLSRVFYGSVSAGVLHRVDRPLLLVRSQ